MAKLPAAAPLAMPLQDLETGRTKRLPAVLSIHARRLVLFGLTGLLIAVAGDVMVGLLDEGGMTGLEAVSFALYLVLFAWTAFGFVSGLAGFMVSWRARLKPVGEPLPIVFTRTALLLPTYNEDPGRILSAIQAMHEDLAAQGASELYDFFVLSDTRDEAVATAEAAGVLRLQSRISGQGAVYYRRRRANTDRKAGNIAEWVQRFGAAYDFMLILDADSLMSAEAVIRLTAEMERDPQLGLLQSAPTIVNAETPFARLQQFASRAYGPMLAAGQDWWSGAEGNYWGHNAIIRTRAFAAKAGLPHLRGPKPFGGHIMSHDFVEAALLRRGGWKVRLAVGLEGSFEETPPTLVDMAVRDRRWCQGNLQHMGVLAAAGLHPISRLHLVRGVLSYVTAPLWLFLLLAGQGVWVAERGEPGVGHGGAGWLFAATMALLIVPKVLAGLLALHRTPAAYGGRMTFIAGMVVEIVLSALIAPVMMLMQTVAVFEILIGRDSGWSAQQRDSERMSRRDAWRTHGGHVLIGLAGAGLACFLDPVMFWWSSPVYLGLVLSAPLALLLSQRALGGWLKHASLFVTPEERLPPGVVRRAAELRADYDREGPVRLQIDRLFRQPVEVYSGRALSNLRFSEPEMKRPARRLAPVSGEASAGQTSE